MKKKNKKAMSTKRIWITVCSLCLAFYVVTFSVFIVFNANGNLEKVHSVYNDGVSNIIFEDIPESNKGADINRSSEIYTKMLRMKEESKSEAKIIDDTRETLQENIFNLTYYNNIYSNISLYYADKTYYKQGDKTQPSGFKFDDEAYVSSDAEYWLACHVNSLMSGEKVYSDGTKGTDNIFLFEVPLKMDNFRSGNYKDLLAGKYAGCIIEGYYTQNSTEIGYSYADGSSSTIVNEIIPTAIKYSNNAIKSDSDKKPLLNDVAFVLEFYFPENIVEGKTPKIFSATDYTASSNYVEEEFIACSETMKTYIKNPSEDGRNYSISNNGFTTVGWIDGGSSDGWLQLVQKTTITFGAYMGEWNGRDIYYVVSALSYPLKTAASDMAEISLIGLGAVIVVAVAISFSLSYKIKKEQQLEQSRINLSNAVAHELKTPLGIIRNHGEAISAGVNPEKTDEYVDVIVRETERLDKLVLDMLDISRLDADKYKLEIENFSLVDLTVSILERFTPLVEAKKLKVELDAQGEFIISADENAVTHVIANFMSNAVKYTPETGRIKIKIEKKNYKTSFSIENEGENIPEEKIENIWEVFYKADESRQRKDNSTGLGLAIAKKYLLLHKATFGCENLENGVMFWFKI